MASGGHQLTVSAVVLSKSNCRFTTGAASISLAIDPSSASPASASASVSFSCAGSASTAAWALSNDSGLHGASASALRMRHASAPADFLPYVLSYPTNGTTSKNVTQTVTLSATVAPADFQNALPGAYSDRITLSLLP